MAWCFGSVDGLVEAIGSILKAIKKAVIVRVCGSSRRESALDAEAVLAIDRRVKGSLENLFGDIVCPRSEPVPHCTIAAFE